MNKNEKLTHNAVRARKAQKKRANKQDIPKKNKGWFSRLLAFIGCLLLVSALAVPCFADDAVPNSDSVVGTWTFHELIDQPEIDFVVSFTTTYDNAIESYTVFEYLNTYNELYYSNGPGDYTQPVYDFANDIWLAAEYRTITITEEPTNPEFATWLDANATEVVPEADPEQVTDVWTQVMNWIVRALNAVQSVFYANGSLTFLGSLAVIGVGIAIVFLFISVVTRFLQLRG